MFMFMKKRSKAIRDEYTFHEVQQNNNKITNNYKVN